MSQPLNPFLSGSSYSRDKEPLQPSKKELEEQMRATESKKSEEHVVVRVPEYRLPLALLQNECSKHAGDFDRIKVQKELLEALVAFGVLAEASSVLRGRSKTLYAFAIAPGVSLDKLIALKDDLALAAKAVGLRIVTRLPGKNIVGIEVDEQGDAVVCLRDLMEEEEPDLKEKTLPAVLGCDGYHTIWVDIARMPHLLIQGTTGTGKSTIIRSIVISLLFSQSPEDLKFVLVDGNGVELKCFSCLPHTDVLSGAPLEVLRKVAAEMESRLRLLKKYGEKSIENLNRHIQRAHADETGLQKLPHVIVIIDNMELLASDSCREWNEIFASLSLHAHDVGIHMLVAMQPFEMHDFFLKDYGKEYFARAVFSLNDDEERLLMGKSIPDAGRLAIGEFTFFRQGEESGACLRSSFVSDEEVRAVVAHCASQAEQEFHEKVLQALENGGEAEASGPGGLDPEDAELLQKCIEAVILERKASTSFLQRRLRIGYGRAARMLELMEQRGIVSPADGANRPREVLVE